MNRFNKNSIFIGNLGYKTTEQTLQQFFTQIGKVSRVLIPKLENGKSKGVGYVEFETEEKAKEAVKKFGKAIIDNRTVFIKLASDPAPEKKTKFHDDRDYHSRHERRHEWHDIDPRDVRRRERPRYDDYRDYDRDYEHRRKLPREEIKQYRRDDYPPRYYDIHRNEFDYYAEKRRMELIQQEREKQIAETAAAIAVERTLAAAFALKQQNFNTLNTFTYPVNTVQDVNNLNVNQVIPQDMSFNRFDDED